MKIKYERGLERVWRGNRQFTVIQSARGGTTRKIYSYIKNHVPHRVYDIFFVQVKESMDWHVRRTLGAANREINRDKKGK